MPKTQTVELPVTPEAALQRAERAVNGLKRFKASEPTSSTSLVAKTKMGFASYGETVTVVVTPTATGSSVTVTSKSKIPALLDWGVNKANVATVVAGLNS